MTAEDLTTIIPKKITAKWLENDDFQSDFVLLKKWTPFEAACLIYGLAPGPIAHGVAIVGRVIDFDHDELGIPDPSEDLDTAELIKLSNIIYRNFDNKEINSNEIIEWAVEKLLLSKKSYFARRLQRTSYIPEKDSNTDLSEQLSEAIKRAEDAETRNKALEAELDRKIKNTGKHHAEKRIEILSAVLSEVCANVTWDGFIKNGRLIAERFVSHFETVRDAHGLPSYDEQGYGTETIVRLIRKSQKLSHPEEVIGTDM